MSKVVIQGNASGTGNFTIAAPNSNTDRTFNLPDAAGTVLTTGNQSDFPAGSVLQVVNTNTSSSSSVNSNTWVDYLSSSITPSSTSSKILILHTVSYGGEYNGYGAGRCARSIGGGSATALRIGSPINTETYFTDHSFGMHTNNANDTYKMWQTSFNYLDSPSTTSEVTYTFSIKSDSGNRVLHVNVSNSNPGTGANAPPNTSVMLLEIAG